MEEAGQQERAEATTGLEVAIVGLAGRFPGAADAEALWANLCAGVESIRPLAEAEILAAGASSAQAAHPRWVKVAADLAEIDLFDAPFFEFSPREAESIDPQHRLFLECAWAALEDAGVDPARSGGPIGVFVGVSASLYAIRNVWARGGTMDLFGGLLGADKDHLATLTSYKLDLEGPSVAVQSACSSALVAVHFAAQSLLNGECDAALAGGSSIAVPQNSGYLWQEGGIVSPDGHCRAFDAQAQGTVFGNGVGAVLLKRLPDALAARDRIHAVIKGSAVNNDGRSRASYTAPRAAGQAKVIRAAQLLAEVDPKTIRFVEAHGTGTPLGDPIEVSALVEAFGPGLAPGSCALGSIKPNIGHLNAAAGIAGLIKATLALERGEIPQTLHFERPNPALSLSTSPFFINTETIPWPAGPGPRRAAVSSFGMGGTNAHAILEQAPPPPISGPSRPLQLLLLSARTETALDAASERLAAHLASTPEALADVAYTLALGRHRFQYRRAVVAGSREEAIERLRSRDPEQVSTGRAAERRVYFLFPGQGAPLGGIGRGLYENEPVFRTEIDCCAELLKPHLGRDLVGLLFAEPGATAEASAAALSRTELAQPALFALEWSLAQLWQSWGVQPGGLLGHSLGELVAATVAGVFELSGALALVALRGRLMQALPPGAMLAVPLSEEKVAARLADDPSADLALAAVNAPDLCVVSGPSSAIERFEREIAPELPEGVSTRRLRTAHAFHSAAMDPALPEFAAAVERVARRAPRLPFVSNLTGTWITPEQAVDPAYWASHLRRTVRFADGLSTLAEGGDAALLEVGPGRSLSTLARRHPATAAFSALPPLGKAGAAGGAEREPALCLGALGRLWGAGVAVDEGALFRSEQRRRVTLPTYPFERRRYWIDAPVYPAGFAEPATHLETPEAPVSPSAPRISGHARPQLGVAYAAPESRSERAVAAVWAELFGFAEVGVHDDFFDLGGSSLLATGLAARLRTALGVEVPLDALFEAPTVARLAAWIDARAAAGSDGAPQADSGPEPAAEALPPLFAAAREGDPPLSFAQERLWFLDRLAPGSPAYNVPAAVRLVGDLRSEALAQALDEVVRRHETLRTTFAVASGRPVQRIAPAGTVALPTVDLSGLAAASLSERELPQLARREALRPFDLVRGPLLRAKLVRLGAADHALLLTVHHIVSDGWSMGVLVAEMTALYGAYAVGKPSPLPALPVQYADFAIWQRGWLSGAVLENQMEYWRRTLSGAPTLALPADRPRVGNPSDRGGRFASELSADLAQRVRALARDREATPFMLLLAAFEALLARLSGERDLVVGTTIANRTQKELEPLIGFFVNTLALRADLSADPPFDAWLGRTRRAALGAYAHQDLPFEQLVAEIAPERDFARSPLFSVLFQLQPAPPAVGADSGLGLEVRPVEAEGQTAKFDLVVSVADGGVGGGFAFDWKFRADLFDRSTVERWAGHWERLVAAAVAAPETRISELPLLSYGERKQLITEWGKARGAYAPFSLSERFAERAAIQPDSVAVSLGGALLTYGDLARRSEACAQRLLAEGVVPGDLVALSLERSIEMLVGILGILRAGAAYVPLDPHYPQERLSYLLEDSGARVLLTDAFFARAEPSKRRRLPDVSPDLPAYVIYTSGSTGKPKGVVVTHANVARLFAATERWFEFSSSDVWTLFHSYAFDFSVWELWGPLLYGGRLEIVPYWLSRSPGDFLRLLVDERVTVLNQTPSAFRQLQAIEAAEANPADLALRAVVFGGEALELSSLRSWFDRRGDLRPTLVNMYGITETTVHVTYRPIRLGDTARASVIGRAIPDLTAQVVDLWNGVEPAPPGVPGEILVGGAGLALGYLGRPELTAARFVPDPASEVPGARLYRSGDLGRRLADGDLEYLGRIDTQVKVRGFRIELGEIEAAIASRPGIRECVVVARGEGGDPRLVAYAVGEAVPTLADLRAYLATRLPDYMVPTALVPLSALPLTAHGKVDRRALPAPDREERSERPRVAPRTPLEGWLAAVWAENLSVGVESVGVEDDFFEQGGNSIRGAVLINRLQQDLGEIVQVVVIFDHPTIASLADYIELEHPEGLARLLAALAVGSAPQVETIPTGLWREGEPLALSFAQERLWFLDRLAPGSAAYNIQAAVRLRGALQVAALIGALGQVVERHAILRARFGASAQGPVQTILPVAAPRVAYFDLAALGGAAEGEGRRLTTLDERRPFDLSKGGLVRLALVRLAPEDHLGLFAMHHIVGDGWSMGLLVHEVGALYAAARLGVSADLPALAVQYPDFALWQQAQLTPEAVAAELSYWREVLSRLVPLPLPTDRPRPPMLSAEGGLEGFAFAEETVAGLDRLAREQGLTRYMALLGSFQALLARISGESDVAVGTTVAGRTRRELEPLIGFFVNTLVLRARLAASDGFTALLAQARDAALGAFAHQEVPFERVVAELQPERDLSRSPLFQVMFQLQNARSDALDLAGLQLEGAAAEGATSKFDLVVNLRESPAGISGVWRYSLDLFDRSTLARWSSHWQHLLAAAVAAPETPFSELPLLSDGERKELITEWGKARGAYAPFSLSGRFAEQAEIQPDAIAVSLSGAVLSYGDLARRSETLAQSLLAEGVVPGDLVALRVERSIEMVVGILGILQAGAAYVPLDPHYPQERLAYLLEDSGARLLLSDAFFTRTEPPKRRRLPDVPPDLPAYVIYTSGSTGKPKGVVVTHANVARLFAATEPWFEFAPSDVWTLFHSYAFDFSVWELWGPLLHGGRLEIVPYWVSRSPGELLRLLVEERVTVLNQTPSAFRQLQAIEAAGAEKSDLALRAVVFGGEALELSSLRPWFARHGDVRLSLINMYGITETTVHVTYRPIRSTDTARASVVGRAIPDLSAHVVDLWNGVDPAPPGVPGEILVGGAGLALGYLGRPALTAARFVPDPNAQVPGARLYRSGDLGRRLPDGDLEYLGRIDTQVKVRGFRIELGEIEAAVASHPGVRDCVVMARGEGGDPRLVAYAAGEAVPTLSDLRAYLAIRLPDYMVPTALVPLAALPLTAHGKVDRRALPAPERELRSERVLVAPRSPLESWLAGIWAEILGLDLEAVGVEDDFFEQGGNSIRGAVLINRLQQDLGEIVQVVVIFDHPTIASLGRYVELEHPEAATRLLATLAAGDEPAAETIPTGCWREGEPLALSFAQERLWFLDRLAPGSAAYNIQTGVRLRGPLDAAALVGALGGVVARHAILRARFGTGDEGPVQVIGPVAAPRVPRFDLVALASAAEREAQRLTTLEARRPFDLSHGGLVRLALVRLGPEDHLGLFAMHHIVGDGWSMGLLVQEVGALYAAALERRSADLPALAVQYPDFALWQQAQLTPDAVAAELGYWRRVLSGLVPLPLPTDRPRPPMLSPEGGLEGFSFAEETVAGLDRLAHERGLTRYMALLASFQALLARISGESDVAVGSTVAGRTRRELEPLIGFFVNTLVLRARLAASAGFTSLLAQAREVALGAFAHQEVPFERVVAELQPERDLSRSPLFQVMFQLQNARSGVLDLAGLELSSASAEGATSKFDLVVNLRESPAGISGVWRYSLDLFDRSTLARWSSHWRHLLAAAVAEPERCLAELPLLSDGERKELITEWGVPKSTFEPFALSARFAEQAAARPDAVAVSLGGSVLTYGEVARRAETLGRRLLVAGVLPGDLVGLCAERSIEMVVGILGIVRAGAAYVPLDPHYPQERLSYLIEDSGVRVLVTERKSLSGLPASDARVLLLDGVPEPSAWTRRLPVVAPDWPAYVIYTSGSTGKPKGVVVTHANVARLFAATESELEFGPADVWTLFHSYAFDFSVWELWGALLYGGRLEIVPYWVSRSPGELLRLVVDERVTVLNQTPSAFRQLQAIEAALPAPAAHALSVVVFGGEALDLASLRPWIARHGEDQPLLVNMYGITETCVHVTYRPLGAADMSGGSIVGPAIPDLCAQVVDLWNAVEPAPIGIPGEILVGGAGLALGYLGRPELTAERFVPDPNAPAPGARLYRSGDLGRRLADGDLEYLGRIDTQVKVRGFRIELGEIESAVLAHPGVRECVVVARAGDGGDRGDPRLVAYAAGEAVPTLSDLRAFLGARLPDYMVPTALVPLAALPLTAHGKVDRRALPAPEREERSPHLRVPPRWPLESWLAGVWAEILGIDAGTVGVEDDFFEQGGNSIRGAVLINRLQQQLGEIVQVVVIFDHPTIASLGAYLAAEHAAAVERLMAARGAQAAASAGVAASGARRVDESKLAALAALVRPLGPPPAVGMTDEKNPPVLFVLSPPRSGTTLLRVMLGGHPALFAPPELELLTFRRMGERRAAFSGRDSFWLEGVLRAVMEIRGGTVEDARDFVAACEARDLPTQSFYGLLEAELGDRMLVDKTPSYVLDPEVLRRGETEFAGARYLHLVRHPGGMIRSFEEAKLDQIFFRRAHSFGRRELAELIWTASHRNILDFLAEVPNERHHRVIFEELVRDPERVLRGVCEFLGLAFAPAMAAPYEERSSRRMTDGPHAASRALGDVKFLGHGAVQAGVAERWREQLDENDLGDPTWEIAAALGYEAPAGRVRERAIPARGEAWPAGAEAPLSFAQERLWFLDRLMPGSPAYNLPLALRLDGDLDLRALRSSLGEIVRRHAVLRTTYVEIDGRPVQRIGDPGRFPLALADLSVLPAARAEGEGARTVSAEARRAFDLARGPVARGLAVRFAAADHGLLLRLHHIAADGWSLGVLVRELVAIYEALAAGSAPALPPLPLQYADYAIWQRGRLAGERLEREIGYWRERLSGAPPIALPTDRPRRPARPVRGARRALALPAGAVESLLEECRRAGATPFMGLLAAFSALLYRWTGQDDLSLGTPVAGRHRAEIESVIGLFVNTLVLRLDLDGEPTWRELLARARAAAVGAFAHQELPFEKVVEELAPARDLATAPLFQVSFSLQNAAEEMPAGAEGSAAGLTLAPWRPWEALGKFDLALTFAERGGPAGGRIGGLEYDRELFDPVTIARLGARLPLLLSAMLARPETPVAELDALAPSERHQLGVEWNDPPGPDAGELPLHELFFRQAARTPERPAVESAEGIWTYAKLAARARAIAAGLERRGVVPGDRVGLAADRSLDQVAGLLGILHAGAAYVPIDPEYPVERRLFMLADARVRAVLGGESARAELAPALGDRVAWLAIDGDAGTAAVSSLPERPAVPALSADTAAYVIYTSGSTGRPKGVVVPHRAIVNRIVWMAEAHPLSADDRVLYKTPLAFDASIWEIFLPLAAGARVVLAQPGGHRDSGYLVGAVIEHGVTVLQLVPSMLQAFLEEPEVASCATLRRLFAGGEALAVETVRRARALLPGASLANLYGPTEAAIDVASNPRVEESAAVLSDAWGSANVPLGRPLSRVRLAVVEPLRELDGEPAGIGTAGELRISGVHLAQGYFGRPDLTAERFIPAPGGERGARAYRTGDLARRLPNGEIEYLGRIDGQVKVRGVRVEIGEIEAVLSSHPAVAQAAVALRGGGRWLAGFWVAKSGASASPEELADHLAARLPEAMLPAILVELPALPTLPNGKVDRAALPEPTFAGSTGGVAPRTPTEQILAAIWAEVLGSEGDEEIGTDDDFFALGGHSLLATRVVARVRGALGVDLPVRAVFEHPTIAALAREIDRVRSSAGYLAAPALSAAARGGATTGLPVSFAQQRLWFLHQLEPESPAYHLPLALRLAGALDFAALDAALAEIARRHEALRTRFPAEDGEPTQEIVAFEERAAGSLPLVDLAALPQAPRTAEARRRAAAEAILPFDLAAGPVSRTTLLRLATEEHVGLLTQHHIVSDAWSRGVLLSELAALYGAALERRASPLPPLPIQYADFALWQREWLRGEVLDLQIGYWRRRLDGVAHALDLPTDRPRPPRQSFRGATRAVRLAPAASRDLRALARRESATPYMLGLALFHALLCRWTGRAEVLVGSPVANRERVEVEGLIGFFANTLVLRGGLGSGLAGSLRASLAAARETVLDATAHQDLPFEKLVEELKPERDPSRPPLVQALYTLQPQTPSAALPGLVASAFAGAAGTTAKFDLTLSLVDAPGGIGGGLEYAAALFDPATAARLAGQVEALFAAAVVDPDADLGSLSLLSVPERHQLAVEWNDADGALAPLVVDEFLARHARERPGDPALESEHESDRRQTWGEVAARVDLLARRLAGLGAGPERPVAVSLEWSVDRALAIYAIWRAGACYLPVDPELPEARRELLLREANAVVLIARERAWPALFAAGTALSGASVLLLGDDGLPASAGPEAKPRPALPENLAYVIYTSGSTGTPKGVAISHRHAAGHFAAAAGFYGWRADDRVIQLGAASFDLAVDQVGMALAAGSTLVVRGPELPPPTGLSAWFAKLRITCATLPTPLWAEWTLSPEPLPAELRMLYAGGEAMTAAAAARFRARLAAVDAAGHRPPLAFNAYGPTETVVAATCHDLSEGRLPDSGPVSIGRLLPRRVGYVVDPAGALQPLGGHGELALGGLIARGYLGRPDLTAERFRPDPWGDPGARAYWTGDRVRRRGDGSFDYLGRIDHQVKIRGFRIEPGEIEAALMAHPGVGEAIVLARETPGAANGTGAGARLIAWYRPIADDPAPDLRRFLSGRLPDYMVPGAFVAVAEWPLGPGGKIDRRALPAPDLLRAARAFAPPRDAVEEVLAGIWAEVLGLERVGIDEDFFDLGGHSLLATRVVSRIHKVFRMDLPLRDFFGGTTVESLAKIVQTRESRPGRAEKIARLYLSVELLPDEGVRDQLAARRVQEETEAVADFAGAAIPATGPDGGNE